MRKRKLSSIEWLGIVLLLGMTLLTTLNVFSRYMLHMSISLTEEVATNLFGFLSFIGAAIAAERGAHLGLTVITDLLPPRANRRAQIFSCFISAALLLFILVLGVDMVTHQIRLGNVSPGLQWPEWIFGCMVPLGCALVAVSFVRKGIRLLREGGNPQ